jgi:hypothetical protein
MRRLIVWVAGLGFGVPAMAADLGEAQADVGGDSSYRCFWVETQHPTYPSWLVSPDPYYYFVPQYYSVYEWACLPEKSHRTPKRRVS